MDYASIVGLVTFLVMMIMIFAGIPVFVSMLTSAFGGFIALYKGDLIMMITKFTTAPFELGANYNYAVLPMFMLVGALAGETGIAGGAFCRYEGLAGTHQGRPTVHRCSGQRRIRCLLRFFCGGQHRLWQIGHARVGGRRL